MPSIPALGRQRQVDLFLSWRSAGFTEQVPGQPGLHKESLSQQTKTQTNTNKASLREGSCKEENIMENPTEAGGAGHQHRACLVCARLWVPSLALRGVRRAGVVYNSNWEKQKGKLVLHTRDQSIGPRLCRTQRGNT